MATIIFYSLLGGLISLSGGLLLSAYPKLVKKINLILLSFAAGAFIAAALLDILPEAVEATTEAHPVFYAAVFGFVLFFILERCLMRFVHGRTDDHGHADHTESLPYLVVVGDTIHNFIDGILIGLAYVANPALGLSVTLAIAAHEIPQEVADFSILLQQGWSRKKVIFINIAQSLLAIPGAIIGYYAAQSLDVFLPYLLAVTSGMFLYIAASDLIPEIHHQAGHHKLIAAVLPMVIGLLLVGWLIALAHSGEGHI